MARYTDMVSIPSLAGQTARQYFRQCQGGRLMQVSIPSLAGQTARHHHVLPSLHRTASHVSIPSLAGQTARQERKIKKRKRKFSGFNPLISGADRATIIWKQLWAEQFCCFNPLISGADRATC